MKPDFDKIIDRTNTSCIKYDWREKYFGTSDVMPLWVADMDFPTPDFIREAVIERAKDDVYGYSFRGDSFFSSINSWMLRRHAWTTQKEWIVFTPGIVPAVNMAVLAYSNPGDGVLLQPPVYHPFYRAVTDHGRKLVYNQLVYSDGSYSIDFDDFRKKAAEVSVFILCHPHNPMGRVWSKEELSEMIRICRENNVVIVSDEIHSDLMLGNSVHTPLLLLEGAEECCAACYSPSKTFNLAGLSTSYMIIPDNELRKKFEKIPDNLHVHLGNIFGNTALEAAYNEGAEWLDALLEYLNDNYRFLKNYISGKIPEIRVIECSATYLVWLDFSGFDMKDAELKKFIIHEAGLGLNDGPGFGPGGSGFQRINIALPRIKLEEALGRLERAVSNRRDSI